MLFCLKGTEMLNKYCHRLTHGNTKNKSNNKPQNDVGLKLFIFCHLNIKPDFQNIRSPEEQSNKIFQ